MVEGEDDVDCNDEDDDEYGGDGGGFLPLPFESFSSSFFPSKVPSPCGDLEFSPTILVYLSSKMILILSVSSQKAFLYASSSKIPSISPKPDMMAMDSISASGVTCTSSISARDKT